MNAARPPFATIALLAANIGIAAAAILNPVLVQEYGFRANAPDWRTAFTCLFIHANAVHLLANMLFLAAVGSSVETSTGVARYLTVYVFSGYAGVLVHFLMTRQYAQPAPYVGASGCIAGCVGYYALRYRGARIEFLPHLALPVWAVTIVWLGLQVVGAFARIGDDTGPSFWSHLGGFGFGVLLSLVFRTPDVRLTEAAHARVRAAAQRGPAARRLAAEDHLRRHPGDHLMRRELAEACRELGEPEAERDALQPLVFDDEEALGRFVELGGAHHLSKPELTRLAHGEHDESLARQIWEALADDADPDSLLDLAAFERDRDPARAATLLQALESKHPLSPAVELARKRGWLT